MRSILAALAFVGVLSACAQGSHIVTGQKRPPVDPSQIKVLVQAPSNSEVIGMVEARSTMGWSDQDKQNVALEELKKQAASLGANAIVLSSTGNDVTSGVMVMSQPYGGATVVPYENRQKTLSAVAVFVQ